jgi:hypothetical protein
MDTASLNKNNDVISPRVQRYEVEGSKGEMSILSKYTPFV